MGISIRSAAPAEQAACLALLPELRGTEPELLIARDGDAIAGAAGTIWRSWSDPGGLPLAIHVLPAWRRQGVGRALASAAIAQAGGEAAGLWSVQPLAAGGAAMAFAAACGFRPIRRQLHFRGETALIAATLAPLAERARRRGPGGGGLSVHLLEEVSLPDVARLVSVEFAQGPAPLLDLLHRARLDGTAAQVDLAASVAVVDGGRVVGALLARREDAGEVIEARVVAPSHRNSPVNLLMLAEMARRGLAMGVPRYRFHCDESSRDTVKLARRCAAAQIADEAYCYYALTVA